MFDPPLMHELTGFILREFNSTFDIEEVQILGMNPGIYFIASNSNPDVVRAMEQTTVFLTHETAIRARDNMNMVLKNVGLQ